MRIMDFGYEHGSEARTIARLNYEAERSYNPALPKVEELPDLAFFAKTGLGVTAVEEDGSMLGFLCAWPPREDVFGTTGIKGTFVPLHAHGVRPDIPQTDRERIYSGMYQMAAIKWVEQGILSHGISLYSHDAAALKSFFYNGFGMRCIDAIRPLKELSGKDVLLRGRGNVEYLELRREEWAALLDGHNALLDHLGSSPIFMKFPRINEEELYRHAAEDIRYFAAKAEGRYIAYIKLGNSGETFVSETEGIRNICGAYCHPEYRGTGIYHNLLAFLIAVLKNEGFTLLGVDYESFNPTARGFWPKYFTEYTNGVVRRIDDKAIMKGETV